MLIIKFVFFLKPKSLAKFHPEDFTLVINPFLLFTAYKRWAILQLFLYLAKFLNNKFVGHIQPPSAIFYATNL
ncbi:hypothetical protein CGC56_10385 [Capnocytophaga canimorsus]|uniref:Uncharacterized protein n=1 Tax=Capnocytophaga canimorsus TaxID=28188 RepID=A0A250G8K5_9FLAO|nr:hypothetical protein CGC56_10385 [Capnocytophaga canimorsus]